MFSAKITHVTTDKWWYGEFETEALMNAWLLKQNGKPNRRIYETWVDEAELTEEEKTQALDERMINGITEFLMAPNATYVTEDITSKIENKNTKNTNKSVGCVIRQLSQDVMDIIHGNLATANLTEAQADQLEIDFAGAYKNLSKGRALTAKAYLDAINPDGSVITQSLLDQINLEYEEYKEVYPDIVVC